VANAGDIDVYDPELARWLEEVVDLSGAQAGVGPEEFFERSAELSREFAELLRFRSPSALERSLLGFAERRFRLVDVGDEYADAGNELLVLAAVLGSNAGLAVPALKRGVVELSAVLSEPGAVGAFGKLLKHLRAHARAANDAELGHWVREVVKALPGEDA
jgi:hypothetical protein